MSLSVADKDVLYRPSNRSPSATVVPVLLIGVGAQSTLGCTKFLLEKYVLKISKFPEFYMILAPENYQNTRIFMIFARKIYKIPEFYMIFCPKYARILRNNYPKNIFLEF